MKIKELIESKKINASKDELRLLNDISDNYKEVHIAAFDVVSNLMNQVSKVKARIDPSEYDLITMYEKLTAGIYKIHELFNKDVDTVEEVDSQIIEYMDKAGLDITKRKVGYFKGPRR